MQKMKLFFILLTTACWGIACSGDKTTPETSAHSTATSTTTDPSSNDALIRRGAYLVDVMSCHDCHSPKQMGPNGPEIIPGRALSGHPSDLAFQTVRVGALPEGYVLFGATMTAAQGPWGVSFAANLTSDETGIGNWTETQFRKALTEGKYKGMDNSRSLLPPMPWPNFIDISDEDLKALFAYLKSTEPVRNAVPAPVPPDEI